jgi:hypothetical protein
VKDQNDLQAMRKGLLKHFVVLAHIQWTTEMKDRIDVLDWDKLSMYDLDVFYLSMLAVEEMLDVLGFVYHSHLVVLEYLF